jgi:hypothetical protein
MKTALFSFSDGRRVKVPVTSRRIPVFTADGVVLMTPEELGIGTGIIDPGDGGGGDDGGGDDGGGDDGGGPPIESDWIMATGYWRNEGFWRNDELWVSA